jgi:SWI/SNF-related matrix-associated actin-dependent regulator 1 of chromatin subfamily A
MKKTPFPHQEEAVEFLLKKKKAILADDMGLGKTFEAILAMNKIRGKKLIVCPASLKLNWEKEIKSVSSDPIVIINSGKKWGKIPGGAWVIINYDILKNFTSEIKKSGFKVATFDEAHYCKSINNNGHGGSKRARSFISIANAIDYIFVLTGTPITNKTKDIFNLLKAIKHPLSKNFKMFANRYCDPVFNGFGYNYDGASNTDELNGLLKPFMLRRLKEEVLDLPDKIRSFIPVDVNIKEYEKKVKEYMQKRSTFKSKHEHLVYLNAMRHILAKEKVKHTIELAENYLLQEVPVVIFTHYKYVVENIVQKFGDEVVRVTGDETTTEKNQNVELFQSGKKKILVANIQSGGVGLTLTKSNVTIQNDIGFDLGAILQSEDRTHRVSQTKNVNILYLYADQTIDEKLTEMLEIKMENMTSVINGKSESFVEELILSI